MNNMCSHRNNARGFSLIELMIVVAIAGILAGVAIPAYSDYVRRGNVTDMVSAMSDAKLRVEQRYADNRSYAGALCGTGTTFVVITTATNYEIRCLSSDTASQTYTITGVGNVGSSISGFVYTVNEAGTKASTVGDVWGGGAVSGRWVVKNGG